MPNGSWFFCHLSRNFLKMSSTKTFSLKEVKEHNDSKSTWLVIYDKIYDVTKFLEEVSVWRSHDFTSNLFFRFNILPVCMFIFLKLTLKSKLIRIFNLFTYIKSCREILENRWLIFFVHIYPLFSWLGMSYFITWSYLHFVKYLTIFVWNDSFTQYILFSVFVLFCFLNSACC